MRTDSLGRAGRTQATGREESQGELPELCSPSGLPPPLDTPFCPGSGEKGDTVPSLSLAHGTSQHITPCITQAHDRQRGLSTEENENPQKMVEMDVVNDGNYWVSGESAPKEDWGGVDRVELPEIL